ncbi:MAG: glycosyltransferase [Flavobacteriaceae bacterium]
MKKALIHDFLIQNGGAERCVESFINIWDDMDVFTLADHLSEENRKKIIKGKSTKTSCIQKMPFSKRLFRYYFSFYPYAVEQFDFSEYDFVLSSSYSVCKGIITRPDQIHITYIYSPVRYVWDLYHQYLFESKLNKGIKGVIVKWMLHYFRNWDAGTANRPDYYIAISHYIAKRVKKIYGKDSIVIYPPVNCQRFSIGDRTEDYYYTASRMVPYKKMDLIVEAFRHMPDKRLIVGGDGPDYEKIKKIAPKNVEIRGFLDMNTQVSLTQRAKAFIFAAEEDFGIAPIEAQACGVPVIAFGKGGALETIIGSFSREERVLQTDTGIFFDKQNVEELIHAIGVFEKNESLFDKETIRNQALKFDTKRFEDEFKRTIENIIQNHVF